jgi:transcriptional regulator with XRE-family HTH domain
MTKVNLPQALMAQRKSKHLSLGQASRMSGIPKSSLYRYEYGLSRIPADAITRVAKAYGVTAADIFENCEDQES